MTHESLFILATAGFALMLAFWAVDAYNRRQALKHHARAKAFGQLRNAYARAEMMVQHTGLAPGQRLSVDRYIDLAEQAHHNLGLGHTDRFARLRQTRIRNSHGLRVVV